MDTDKISNNKLIKILVLIWVVFLFICFFINFRQQKDIISQLFFNTVFKERSLPVSTMTDSKFLQKDSRGFFTGKINVPKGEDRNIVAGPYWPLINGSYELQFVVSSECTGSKLGNLDVATKKGLYNYDGRDLFVKGQSPELIKLAFDANLAWDYEFRLFSNGSCDFNILDAKIIRKKFDFRALFNQIVRRNN